MWIQTWIELRPRPRGFHLVTDEIVAGVPDLQSMSVGIATVFMQHTSASLTLNENSSPDVPAHIKASLTGSSLVLPVSRGRLTLGTWQGIYLCEHRNNGGSRSVVVTAVGE